MKTTHKSESNLLKPRASKVFVKRILENTDLPRTLKMRVTEEYGVLIVRPKKKHANFD